MITETRCPPCPFLFPLTFDCRMCTILKCLISILSRSPAQLIAFRFLFNYKRRREGPMMSANYPPTVGFMNTSILAGPHGGTLRRVREIDSTPPRILSKIDIDPQFYYGWPATNQTALTGIDGRIATPPTVSTLTKSVSGGGREHIASSINSCPPPGRTYCF